MILVAPPGMELKRVLPGPEGEGAQALGENPTTAAGMVESNPLSTEVSPPTRVGVQTTTARGLVYTTLKEGTGRDAKPGDMVTVHYTGTLEDGTKFDSSRDTGEPIRFALGRDKVIKGWDEGVSGMKEGERRKLTIPAHLGYGPNGRAPVIPSNATLIFDVELVKVEDGPRVGPPPPSAR
jgi:FKBP-type peptidyl-prolyl cis-trans isomerase